MNLVTRTEALKRFSKEVLDTTAAQSKEVGDLKAEGQSIYKRPNVSTARLKRDHQL